MEVHKHICRRHERNEDHTHNDMDHRCYRCDAHVGVSSIVTHRERYWSFWEEWVKSRETSNIGLTSAVMRAETVFFPRIPMRALISTFVSRKTFRSCGGLKRVDIYGERDWYWPSSTNRDECLSRDQVDLRQDRAEIDWQEDLHWRLCKDLLYCEVHDVDAKKESEKRMVFRGERGPGDELQILLETRREGKKRAWRQWVWLRKDASCRRRRGGNNLERL